MKKVIALLLLLTITCVSFSQAVKPESTLAKEDYLRKSKRQQTAGYVLGGSATVLFITGLVLNLSEFGDGLPGGNNADYNPGKVRTGNTLMIAGGVLFAGAIYLQLASKKNKRIGFAIKNIPVNTVQNYSIITKPNPSFTLKIRL